jgi:hypothetical protein
LVVVVVDLAQTDILVDQAVVAQELPLQAVALQHLVKDMLVAVTELLMVKAVLEVVALVE